MAAPEYASADAPVREDLRTAHRRAWVGLAAPGAWWTGAERVSLAAEVRNAGRCPLCRERKRALSAAAVQGEHLSEGRLPAPAVEAAHKIASDPGRLSRGWFEELRSGGLEDGPYVELLGVVVTVVSIDAFCVALGLPLHPLPEPQPGAPSHYRPDGAVREAAWVPMLPARVPGAAERDLWPAGRAANVIRALSLVPDEVRMLKTLSAAHYVGMEHVQNPATRGSLCLERAQTELLAGRVSARNECFY